MTSNSTSVVVQAGASLTAGAGDAAAFTATTSGAPFGSIVGLRVDGTVDGAGANGVLETNDPADGFSFPSIGLNIVVGADGRITGATPLRLRLAPENMFGEVFATLDNAGSIQSSTGGAAIVAEGQSRTRVSINNRQTGTIGAIQATIGSFVNNGTIAGGGMSAATIGGENSGTIRNAGDAATLALRNGSFVLNSGTIANAGPGAAIDSTVNLSLENRAGGLIASGGSLAVRGGSLTLVNRGTIDGSVVATGAAGSEVDTIGGLIDGDVRLGDGDDRLAVSLDLATGRIREITGAIDVGGGSNRAEFALATGGAIDGLAAAARFSKVQYTLSNDAALTLASAPGYVIALAGSGSLTTSGTIAVNGPLVTFPDRYSGSSRISVTNLGDIVSTLADPTTYALAPPQLFSFVNRGTITAIGGGAVDASRTVSDDGGGLVNEGTITASGTAVYISGQPLTNSGTIRSTGGTAAVIELGGGQVRSISSTNSGTIEGAARGVMTGAITLVNTGTIGATAGIGVDPGFSSTIDNRAGGLIRGTIAAIGFGSSFFSREAIIVNAGRIEGAVDLSHPGAFDTSSDVYADTGGTLAGDLRLGGGDDLLLTDYGRLVDGRFTGISGIVDGGEGLDKVRLRVTGDLTAAIVPVAGFEGIGYELANGAALRLTSARPLTTTLDLTGRGSVDLGADIATINDPVVSTAASTLDQLLAVGVGNADVSALSIVNRGTLSYTLISPSSGFSGVLVTANSTFENAGTLNVTSAPGVSGRAIGLFGSDFPFSGTRTIVNSGTINLDGSIGISGNGNTGIINRGRIVQAPGGSAASIGVSVNGDLTNSGTIETGGWAVSATSFASITNSGRIASTGDAAIRGIFADLAVANLAGGTISGGAGVAIRNDGRTIVTNAGTIEGDVLLGRSFSFGNGSVYVAEGGRLNGNLLFSPGNDTLLVRNCTTGVSGTIDAGDGIDRYGTSFSASGSITIGGPLPATFEEEAVEAIGRDTIVTINGPAAGAANGLVLYGDGMFVNRADVLGSQDSLYSVSFGEDLRGSFVGDSAAASFTNQATLRTGVTGFARSFVNDGTIGSASRTNSVLLFGTAEEAFTFSNTGSILGTGDSSNGFYAAVALSQGLPNEGSAAPVSIANQGQISGGLAASLQSSSVSFVNGGTISRGGFAATSVSIGNFTDTGNTLVAANSGMIEATGTGGAALLVAANALDESTSTISITNSGTVIARRDGLADAGLPRFSAGLVAVADSGSVVSVVNAAGGRIAAPGVASVALVVPGGTLDLVNAGTITGGAGTAVEPDTLALLGNGGLVADGFIAGAIQTGEGGDRIRNSGTITGSIDLGAGDDVIENSGLIDGMVYLRSGNDRFVQSAGAIVTGVIDGGDGIDALAIDATGGGTVAAMRYVNFESVTQSGSGSVAYSGAFAVDTIGLAGGTATIAAGETVSTAGPITFTGSGGGESIDNAGTIAGGVALGGGDDSVVNRGTIRGAVMLGASADTFVEGAGSTAAAGVDGGDGIDTYIAALAGDRTGLGARSGFERLGVTGAGTLTLRLDQAWDMISLAGTGLALDPSGFAVARIAGGDGGESVAVRGDTAAVALGGGNDDLALSGDRLSGSYDGGAGSDRLTLTAPGTVTLAGTASGFETIALAGGRLDVAGTLGAAADRTTFGDAGDALTLLAGGRLLGAVSLGGGADMFRLAAGAALDGTVSGGDGSDRAVLELTADLAIDGDRLGQFEVLEATDSGALRIARGTARFDTVLLGDNALTVDAGATLVAGSTSFGAGANRLTLAGTFAGAVDLGAGDDVLRLTGSPAISGSIDAGAGSDRFEVAVSGTEAAPTALGTTRFVNFEALAHQSGVASFAGNLDFATAAISGGRLIGLAGSRLTAPTITVASGATFGSAGAVIGNIVVAGTLSPGASPGTMAVTGNVALAAGSTTLLELSPSLSDQLVVSGAVTIASGASLSLVGTRPLTPGISLDLIVATGGISGTFGTISQAASVGGFLSQSANRLQLLGTFRTDAGFSPQVNATIGYVNGVLVSGQGGSALVAAVPQLLAAGGASNPDAFRRLSPEAYAAASQLGAENGLTIIEAARAQSRTTATSAGLFTFGQALTNHRTIPGDRLQGTASARMQTYGGMGGIGIGAERGWIGAFVGYLDGRQRLRAIDARTDADGVIAGVQGEVSLDALTLGALVAYDGGKATTRRALPGSASAAGRYDLHSWIGDVTARYTAMLGGWAVQPRVGVSYVRSTRGRVAESGTGPFLLDVARDRAERWFVNGDIAVIGGREAGARVHPYVSLGVRRAIDGRGSLATAALRGASTGFTVPGAARDRTVATAGGGIGVDLTGQLSLFGTYAGEFGDGPRHNGLIGLRFRM
ncbi:autotransporter outer membrane beta-barrel domain-containing protein [Sphingomonas profundi]|uniref:autotransporter outer membrane beta-barrel domain-containing protein n=1 Tax=Alterirhizorhabdus profundi TaxID=2681549 RepID=UPI0012E7A0D1|nr:autotransporter outer membrane beta-barrel domain-containing protein [Sphingomonas profundi]